MPFDFWEVLVANAERVLVWAQGGEVNDPVHKLARRIGLRR